MALISELSGLASAYWLHILAAALVTRLLYNRYGKGLSGIPGPFIASLSDIWLLVHYTRRKGLEDIELHTRYNSDVVRVGPNTVSVGAAEAVRIVYGWKPILEKARLYISQDVTTVDGTVLENVSSTRNENTHRDLRRPITNAYSLSTLVEYEPLVDKTSIVLMQELEKFADSGETCPFHKWFQMYAFDVIGDLTFSKQFGFLKAGKDLNNLMHHTAQAMDWIGMVGQVPTLDEYLRLKGLGVIWRRFRKTGPIMKFTAKQILEHNSSSKATGSKRPDFLSRFVAARERYPELMTDQRLAAYANTNVSAGSDTTAIALREVLFRMVTNPDIGSRVLDEVRRALQARHNRADEDMEKPITWKESQEMLYFQALIKECLRMHPPLGQLIPRVVPRGGLTIAGQYLPEGTVVGCNAWVVNRDPRVFGEDAHEFRPERWLSDDEEHIRNMDNLSFSFGGGPRICLGKNIALLEISKMIPELMRRYEVKMVDPKSYKLIPGWLVLQTGLDAKVSKRDPKWWM